MAFLGPDLLAEPLLPLRSTLGPVGQAEARYPARLRVLPHPPASLWFSGRLPLANERLIAMVGARAATGAGRERAHGLAAALAGRGLAIVSGGAFGIDACSHEGALTAGAATYAVLGCGTDIAYPDRHAGLFAAIAKRGGLLSEYPPGTPPRRGQFPARNRIIAALGEAVIVVEAALRSGALITAQRGRELGRPVLAVPGSSGTDTLIRGGKALLVETADDVLAALAGSLPPRPMVLPAAGPHADLVAAMVAGATTPSLLCQRLQMTLPALLARLAEAELDGLVQRAGGDTYEVTNRAF